MFANEGDALCAIGVPRGKQIKGRGHLHSAVVEGKIVQVGFVELADGGHDDWSRLGSAVMQQLNGVAKKVPLYLFSKSADASGVAGYRFRGGYAYDGNARGYVHVASQMPMIA